MLIQRLLLPEILGDLNARDRFLHGGVDLAHRAKALTRHAPGQRTKTARHQIGERTHRQREQRQLPFDQNRIGSKINTVNTWLIRSVTSVTICANSCVSDVMRLTILPVLNSS